MIPDPESYIIICRLFPRILGIIYLLAFFPFLFQARGLLGKEGILPIGRYYDYLHNAVGPGRAVSFLPSLFWMNSSDAMLTGVVISGNIAAILLILGVMPAVFVPILYVLFLSLKNSGQEFLSFGWDVFILEITASTFLLTLTNRPNPFVLFSLFFLLFRFHFWAGASKIKSRDKNWRNLTALHYHYLTEPLPNTLSWYAYRLPLWFHKLSVLMMFFIEIPLAFAIFMGEWMRITACIGFVGLQFSIWLTGNFSYLNHMTALFSLILLPDFILMPIFGSPSSLPEDPVFLTVAVSSAAVVLIVLQIISFYNQFKPVPIFQKILRAVEPYHIANRYGIFAIMTTKRYEIVLEGSKDGEVWKEYLFKYKPSEVSRRPRRVAPYHPRLDWQMWFLPFSNFEDNTWFHHFLISLLEGKPHVASLIRYNPFPNKPPKYIRALAYDYTFAPPKSKDWWKRTLAFHYSSTLSLKADRDEKRGNEGG